MNILNVLAHFALVHVQNMKMLIFVFQEVIICS